ncbi:GNAT family N-acetyltransferase [Aquabacterium olei]|uniref:GNAT family N-acetyltransferase n=1 Tax=Aquabacterium olei TaxID=1296669 RepID=A0A2U8FLY7_9BURK|nr:GNAT family protein [Aquabacterium olei]AWI52061.1 GNAT family N-acetyltransferase [Aquabacterium olei]
MKVDQVTLTGRHVRLEPLAAHHLPGLAEAIEDGQLWTLPVTFVPPPAELDGFLAHAETAFAAGRELAFATVSSASGRIVGSTRFRCIEAAHRRVEIGFTFLAASAQRTPINTEAKLLMLTHAFETWGCNRVELLTDERNTRSRQAILRLGATEEGLLRSHMVMRDGFVRNSVIFSITRAEWPQVKAGLLEKTQLTS